MGRPKRCQKCNRFSHCNNNELVCLEKFREVKQLLEDSEYDKYKQIIDEIEDICKNGRLDECYVPLDECSLILKIISELKGEQK